jgi:hypothetical protein
MEAKLQKLNTIVELLQKSKENKKKRSKKAYRMKRKRGKRGPYKKRKKGQKSECKKGAKVSKKLKFASTNSSAQARKNALAYQRSTSSLHQAGTPQRDQFSRSQK